MKPQQINSYLKSLKLVAREYLGLIFFHQPCLSWIASTSTQHVDVKNGLMLTFS